MADAVIVSTARTPLCKSWRGALNMTHGATLGSFAVQAKDDSRLGEAGKKALAAAVAGPQRSEANRARDVYRHPVETALPALPVRRGKTASALRLTMPQRVSTDSP